MSPWKVLGLKRTDDVREIRRAYARKLKATDVDADPAAFIALREALDRALADAAASQYRQAQPAAQDEPELAGASDGVVHDAFDPPSGEVSAADPDDGNDGDDGAERFTALERLLFQEEGAPPPHPDELVAALREIIDHPLMAHVDHSASVEGWLAETLYYSIPRSDPLIPIVVHHFHWDEHAGQWDQPWLFEELVKRRNAFDLLDALADPRHPLHKAYRDLVSDKPRLGFVTMAHASKVGQLLSTIRNGAPAAEDYLSSYRVALWDEKLSRSVQGRLKWVFVGFWALFILAKVVAAINAPPSPQTAAVQPLSFSSPAQDLDPVIRQTTENQLDLAALEASNPPLHARLVKRWEQARDRREQTYALESGVRTILNGAIGETLRGGSYETQALFWQLRADQLIWLRQANVEACDPPPGQPAPQPAFPPELVGRGQAISTRALQEAVTDPPPALAPGAESRFSIPSAAFEDIVRRSGMPAKTVQAALTGGGTARQRCDARIALIQAALNLPSKTGKPLLRDMSAGL